MSDLSQTLIQSMVGPLANKVKLSANCARKNQRLGEALSSTFALIFEQVIPHYCKGQSGNLENLNNLHNLVFLLAQKCHSVFFSHVIHTAIDQNWDLKGLKQVLVRLCRQLELNGIDSVISLLDGQIKS